MNDIYLYEDVPVLKNKFGIKDEKTLDLVEAEQSRASMMLLYTKTHQIYVRLVWEQKWTSQPTTRLQ